jgi:hypothetical protein
MDENKSTHVADAPADKQSVHSKLDAVRRAMVVHQLCRLTLLLALLAILWAWVVGAADFWLEISFASRALAFAGLLAAIGGLLWSGIRAARRWNETTAAARIEQSYPEFGQALRTAQQYTVYPEHAVPAAPHLVTRLVDDVRHRMQRVELGEVVPWNRLMLPIAGLAAALLTTLGIVAFVPETLVTAGRLLLGPLQYTNVVVVPHERPVPQATDVTIQVDIAGRPLPQPLELLVRPVGQQQWQRVVMQSADQDAANALRGTRRAREPAARDLSDARQEPHERRVQGKQLAKIVAPQADVEYRVVGGPVDSPIYRLRVLPPLVQETLEARITPPAYTQLPPESTSDTDVTVVEGSQLEWNLVLNREPAEVRLEPIRSQAKSSAASDSAAANSAASTDASTDAVAALPVAQLDGNRASWRLDAIDQNQRYEVVATAADGIEFRSKPIQVRVKKDRAPTIVFRQPAETLEVTPTTEVQLGLEVQDDYGLSHIGIEYDLGDGTRHVLWEATLEGQAAQAVSPTLFLEEHRLNFDDSVTYYAFAQDNRPDGVRTTSPLRFIDIRPYKREYEIVNGQCQGGGGGCLSLDELIARQRHTLNLTFMHRDSSSVDAKLSARIGRSQQEILTATQEFTAGWESQFGPEPALQQAMDAMRKSLESVEQPDLPTTADHQSRAMVSLVKARKNLRQFVKNCSSSGQSACVSFDQQMAQRLRQLKEEGEKLSNEVSPSQLQQQLDQIAQNQRQWSEQVSPAAGEHGAQLEKDPAQSSAQKPRSSEQPKPGQSKPGQSKPGQSKPGQSKPGQGTPGQSDSEKSDSQHNTPAELMAAQEAAERQVETLQRVLEKDPRASETALRRMEELAEQIRKSEEAYAQANEEGQSDQQQRLAADQAAQLAKQASQRADALRDHLLGLMAADLNERFARADQLAQRIAAGQETLAQRSSSGQANSGQTNTDAPLSQQQDDLIEETKALDDLLKHLAADTSLERPELARGIDQVRELYPPEQVIRQMEQAAEVLREQETVGELAASATQRAAEQIRLLADQLRELHRQLLQPKLDELLAAEAQAAELLAALQAGGNEATLAAQLPALANRASELHVQWQPTTQGLGTTQLAEEGQLRGILRGLQAKIQEVVLMSAEMDADEPVPPQYQPLVDEYYRAISDDLR